MLVVFPDASIPQTANGTKKDTTTGNTSTSIYSPLTGDTTDLSGYADSLQEKKLHISIRSCMK